MRQAVQYDRGTVGKLWGELVRKRIETALYQGCVVPCFRLKKGCGIYQDDIGLLTGRFDAQGGQSFGKITVGGADDPDAARFRWFELRGICQEIL